MAIKFEFTVSDIDAQNIMNAISSERNRIHEEIIELLCKGTAKDDKIVSHLKSVIDYLDKLKLKMTNYYQVDDFTLTQLPRGSHSPLAYSAWRRKEAYGIPMSVVGNLLAGYRWESFQHGFLAGLNSAASTMERLHKENKKEHSFFLKGSNKIRENAAIREDW